MVVQNYQNRLIFLSSQKMRNIKSNRNKIEFTLFRLIWNSKRTSVWFQINWCALQKCRASDLISVSFNAISKRFLSAYSNWGRNIAILVAAGDNCSLRPPHTTELCPGCLGLEPETVENWPNKG